MRKDAKANVTPVRQRTQYSWEDQPLGQVPDHKIAAKLGCRRQAVIEARQRRGIAAFDSTRASKGIRWDTVPLGTMPDTEIAKTLGVATPVVFNARERRGIPPFKARCTDVAWDDVPLGEFPDAVLAEFLGVSQPTITRHRNRLGILPSKARFITTEGQAASSYGEALIDLYWHEQGVDHDFQVQVGPYVADWVLGDGTIVEFAGFIESRAFGERYKDRLDQKIAYYRSIYRKVQVIYPKDLTHFRPKGAPEVSQNSISGDINWSDQPLGKMSDTELAKHLGVTQTTVTRWRTIFGIAPFCSPDRDWSTIPLGEEPDPVIASRLGVSKETVRRARLALGIPSFRSNHHAA